MMDIMDIIVGIVLIVMGFYSLLRPEKGGIFTNKPSLAKQRLSPSAYLKYKRFLGVFLIIVGLFLASVAIIRITHS